MKSCVFPKSKIICFLLISIYSNAQYRVLANKDLNQDKIKDIVHVDTIRNTIVFEYGGLVKNKKKDSIFFFSNYPAEAGNVHLKVIGDVMIIKFVYAPKYLDYDLMNFKYKKVENDWILNSIISSRTNPLSDVLMTEKCHYEIPAKMNFSLKKNNFDNVQENLIDNKKYLIKCTKKNIE